MQYNNIFYHFTQVKSRVNFHLHRYFCFFLFCTKADQYDAINKANFPTSLFLSRIGINLLGRTILNLPSKKVKYALMSSITPLPAIRPLSAPIHIRLARALFLFALGGSVYYFIEILWRGHSHFSMFLCGGFCFSGLYIIHHVCRAASCVIRWIFGAIFITVSEFWCGVAVNLILDWHVWNYADQPFNLLGQVCLPFTLIWLLLCIPADWLCSLLRKAFRIESPQKY